MTYQVVVLAAGLGSRLGRPHPKTLTPLADGRSILGLQVGNMVEALGGNLHVIVVVGFKRDMVMEAFPDLLYAYNEYYDTTNTSRSLLKALRLSSAGGVLWLNGDVVFDSALLRHVQPLMEADQSFVCVDRRPVGHEEVSYTLDTGGAILELRKGLADGLGEAIGINYVSGRDKPVLLSALERCADDDYFERGLELAITDANLRFHAVDITPFNAVEVDFPEDLLRANESLQ